MSVRQRSMTAVYLTHGDRILLLYRIGSRVADSKWTGAAGGHFEPKELRDPQACALRELREETGITPADILGLELRYVTMRLKNGEIRQNYYYFAELIDPTREIVSNEGVLQWFRMDELDGLPMPFTARYVLGHYIRRGRENHVLYGGLAAEDGVKFARLEEF